MEQPKYQTVQAYVLNLISTGKLVPGDRAPSENELASRFRISRQTARHALSGLVTQGILSRRRGSGTYVSQNTKRIGVCIKYLDTYIFPDIIRGIDERLKTSAGSLVMMSSRNDLEQERSALESLLSYQLDGLIWEPARSHGRSCDDQTLGFVLRSGIPAVLINSPLDCDSVSQVLTSDAEGMLMLTEHLHQLGHKRIGGFFCQDMSQGQRRYQGFMTGLGKFGIETEEDDLLWFEEAQLTADPGHILKKALRLYLKRLKQRGITAVCCYNDMAAQLVIAEAANLGISVPQDLAVTGFDAAERLKAAAGQSNKLTSVIHPCAELGSEAVAELMRLSVSKETRIIEMPATAVYGSSTAGK